MIRFGASPDVIGSYDLDFTEYMHFMYLPVSIPGDPRVMVPERLAFARPMIVDAMLNEMIEHGADWDYVYVTARRGFATPGNPLNRPGWHADGFGTDDINYVWTDAYPTLFAVQEFENISTDHVESAWQFEEQAYRDVALTFPDRTLLRLDSSVIHAAPEIPAPGGERSFFKVSFSNERYNLRGNSHNYLLDYSWPMHDRAAVRNDPAHAESDSAAA